MKGKISKKCLSFVFIIFLISSSMFAKPKFMLDIGKFSIAGFFGDKDVSFCPTIIIPEIMMVGEKTGLYTSFSPFEMQFKFTPNEYLHEGYTQNWSLSEITFINANIGWMKQLNKELLLETYVRMNTISAFNIEKIRFSPSVEISWTSSIFDETINPEKVIFMPKVISLQVGASFENLKGFKPYFFVTTSVDVILFAGLFGILTNY